MPLHDLEAKIKGQIWPLQNISKKLFSHSNKGDKVAILFSKQGQNYSQASFSSHLHFVKIWHS